MTDLAVQEAEALLSLETQATPGPWGLANTSSGGKLITRGTPEDSRRTYQASVQIIPSEDADLIVALRNRAPAVIRALMERVREFDSTWEHWVRESKRREDVFQARIASLEAVIDVARRDASRHLSYNALGGGYPLPCNCALHTALATLGDLSEIAGRVETKRKERTP